MSPSLSPTQSPTEVRATDGKAPAHETGEERTNIFARLHGAAVEQQRARQEADKLAEAEKQADLEKRHKAMLGAPVRDGVFDRLHKEASIHAGRRSELVEKVAEKAGVSFAAACPPSLPLPPRSMPTNVLVRAALHITN